MYRQFVSVALASNAPRQRTQRAAVPVKYTDGEGVERTRFQRVGAMFRNTRNGDGSEFFSLKLDFPVGVQELVMFPPSSKEPQE